MLSHIKSLLQLFQMAVLTPSRFSFAGKESLGQNSRFILV